MKANYLLVAAAALALASCSNEEPVAINQGTPIGFRTAVDSRAQEMTIDKLSNFYVTALFNETTDKYFHGVTFAKGDDGTFTSASPYFWPGNSHLAFFAYAALDADGKNHIDPNTLTFNFTSPDKISYPTVSFSYTLPTDVDGQLDLVAAFQHSTNQTDNPTIELDFYHLLSQISLSAKNTNTNYQYIVTGVRIGGVHCSGTHTRGISSSNGGMSWTPTGNPTTISITLDPAVEIATSGTESILLTRASDNTTPATSDNATTPDPTPNNILLIPQELKGWYPNQGGAYLALKVKIGVKSGTTDAEGKPVYTPFYPKSGDGAWIAVPISTTLQHGYKYDFTLDLSRGAGYVAPDQEAPEGWSIGDKILGGEIKLSVKEQSLGWTTKVNDNGDFEIPGDIQLTEPETGNGNGGSDDGGDDDGDGLDD